MSQATNPAALVSSPFRARRTAILLGLLALVVAALVVVALTATGSERHTASRADSAQHAERPDGGPSESAVAGSVGARPSAGPNESAIAAGISFPAPRATAGPDESRIAAAVSHTPRQSSAGPDESRIAASLAGH